MRSVNIVGRIMAMSALLVAAAAANANLLVNGSYEEFFGGQAAPGAGSWKYYSALPGWTGENNIEIHGSPFLASAQDGNYYAELNAHPRQDVAFAMNQSVDLVAGLDYELSFWAQKRQSNDGNFWVSVGGDLSEQISSHVVGQWQQFVYSFTATGGATTLRFLSGQSGSDTVGHFLDNVSLVKVPEPGTLGLLLCGLGAVVLGRRRTRV